MTDRMRIPVLDLAGECRDLKPELDAAFARVVSSATFIGGEEVSAFEREFAAYLGARHVVGVGNGTDALELALCALDIGRGDTVLTVPFTFAATLEAITRAGAEPLLVDVCDDFTLDVDAAEALFRRHKIKAVVPVHLYGQPADLDRLLPLARAHGAAVIEDAAQAHGAWCTIAGMRTRAGTVGDMACFSFYPTKNLGALGDAGAVVTNRDDLAERVRLLANHGERSKYRHVLPNGRNSRLDALQAAVLRVKLPRLDGWTAARRRAAEHYAALLRDLPLRLPTERPGVESVYHQYAIRARARDQLRESLARRGIATSVHYPVALHQQDGFRYLGFAAGAFPIAERCAAEVLCLPMSPHLSIAAIEYVATCLRQCL